MQPVVAQEGGRELLQAEAAGAPFQAAPTSTKTRITKPIVAGTSRPEKRVWIAGSRGSSSMIT